MGRAIDISMHITPMPERQIQSPSPAFSRFANPVCGAPQDLWRKIIAVGWEFQGAETAATAHLQRFARSGGISPVMGIIGTVIGRGQARRKYSVVLLLSRQIAENQIDKSACIIAPGNWIPGEHSGLGNTRCYRNIETMIIRSCPSTHLNF
jgi:hypothetical protein